MDLLYAASTWLDDKSIAPLSPFLSPTSGMAGGKVQSSCLNEHRGSGPSS